MTTAAVQRAPIRNRDPVSEAFVGARRAARALKAFPGQVPTSLAEGYAHQDAALALWPDQVVGWKVGRVAAPFLSMVDDTRLAGPIFTGSLWRAEGARPVEVPVFEGGFAAVEAEFVFRALVDAPAGKTQWTPDEALALPHALHIGVEMAGSPLAAINDLGPTVVVSDFGNNAGLVLGPAMGDWNAFAPEALACECFIDGACVGAGSAANLPEGLLAAAAFLLGHVAARGRPLRAGQLISTGAITGIHDIRAGQSGRVSFGRWGEIAVKARPATAETQ